MVRIRYKRTDSGDLISKEIEAPSGLYRISIVKTVNENNIRGFVYDIELLSNSEWHSVEIGNFTRNLTVAKNKAKLSVKSKGAMFYDEVRRKSKNEAQ